MKKILSMVTLAGTLAIAAGCSGGKVSGNAEKAEPKPNAVSCIIGMKETIGADEPALLSLMVYNRTGGDYRFLVWNTPFEQTFLDDYLDIADSKGEKIAYRGAMARRVWPPPAESYKIVSPGQPASVQIDIRKAYTLAPGSYTIRFKGGFGDQPLPASNTIALKVK